MALFSGPHFCKFFFRLPNHHLHVTLQIGIAFNEVEGWFDMIVCKVCVVGESDFFQQPIFIFVIGHDAKVNAPFAACEIAEFRPRNFGPKSSLDLQGKLVAA